MINFMEDSGHSFKNIGSTGMLGKVLKVPASRQSIAWLGLGLFRLASAAVSDPRYY